MEPKMLSELTAILFAVLTTAVVLFQLALVFGAPWGEFTLGGKYRGKLPHLARIIPIVSGALLTGCAVIVLARAGLAFAYLKTSSNWLVWVVIVYCVVGTIANLITPSRRERALWLPIIILMLVSSTVVGMT